MVLSLRNDLGRLRATGFLEGLSWVILLFIAMPLKYFADMPLMVRYTGWVHGILFILYVMQLFSVWSNRKLPSSFLVKGFIAAFLPFGTLIYDRTLKNL